MLCGGPQPATCQTESVNHGSSGTLSESSRLPMVAATSLQGWRSHIHESEVFPNHPTFKETGRKEPGTLQDNRHPRDALCYNPPSTTFPRGPPSVPHLPTLTHLPEPLSPPRSPPSPPNRLGCQ